MLSSMNIFKKFFARFRKRKEIVQNPEAMNEVEMLRNFNYFQSNGGISHEKKEAFGVNVNESELK